MDVVLSLEGEMMMFCGHECQFSAGEFREKERVLWEVCNRVKGTKQCAVFLESSVMDRESQSVHPGGNA